MPLRLYQPPVAIVPQHYAATHGLYYRSTYAASSYNRHENLHENLHRPHSAVPPDVWQDQAENLAFAPRSLSYSFQTLPTDSELFSVITNPNGQVFRGPTKQMLEHMGKSAFHNHFTFPTSAHTDLRQFPKVPE